MDELSKRNASKLQFDGRFKCDQSKKKSQATAVPYENTSSYADYMYDALKGDQAIHRFVAVRILVTTSLVDVIHCSYIILWNCMGKAL